MRLKCAGAVSGEVEVDDAGTIGALVDALERKAGVEPGKLKVIAGGKTIPLGRRDDTLVSAKIGPTTRLVVSRVGPNPAMEAEAARAARESARRERLDRIARAAESIAGRTAAGRKRTLEIETQGGELARLPEADRVALTQGLALHQKGRRLVDEGVLLDGLGVLELAEEAFAVADPSITERLDNPAILALDVAWAVFQLRDPARLPDAVRRLERCREGFARAHGADLSRLRALHGGFQPELGLYVRLELLEAVAAFHDGDVAAARASLASAKARRDRLRVSDDALASLLAMGFEEKEATRALRFCGGDAAAAAAFIVDRRRRDAEAKRAAEARRASARERRRYGLTPAGALVDEGALETLCGMGYPRALAAAALRATENAVQMALDALAMARDALEEDAAATEAENAQRKAARRREPTDRGGGRGRGGGGGGGEGGGGGDADAPLTGDAAIASDPAGDAGERDGSSSGDDDSGSGGSSDAGSTSESGGDDAEEDLTDSLTGDGLREYDVDLDAESEAIDEYLAKVAGVDDK